MTLATVAVVVVGSIGGVTSSALGAWEGKLPPKTGTLYPVEYTLHGINGFTVLPESAPNCIGPGRYSGGKIVWVYGLKCNNGSWNTWEFTALNAFPGIYNPNSYEIRFYLSWY